MKPEDIQKLMDLNGWNRTELAAKIGVKDNTVHQWLKGTKRAGSSAQILMKLMMESAKASKLTSSRKKAGA